MQRYFMTIPEAVALVLQASVIGKGGEVMVLDMGVPIMIVKLAEELIRIHGLVPYRDVDIRFTGMRPGEKLFEELLTAEEGTIATRSNKVFVARSSERFSRADIEGILAEFRDALADGADGEGRRVRALLRAYIRHYQADAAAGASS
jgi:FlaA1/EpsC-like NDP-sugar epimerase